MTTPMGMDWVKVERFLDHRLGWADLSRPERAELVRRSMEDHLSAAATAVQLRTTERTVCRWRARLRQRQVAA